MVGLFNKIGELNLSHLLFKVSSMLVIGKCLIRKD
jgi:hypothetical protein